IVEDFWEVTPPPESSHFWPCFELVEVTQGHAGDALPGGKVAVITRDPGTSPPGTVNPPDLIAALDLLRTKKTAYEIECLAEASPRAVRGHRRAAELFQTHTPSELDLHLAYLAASEQDDLWAPYKGIVALGAHAAVLHFVAYTRERVSGATPLLVDAGARGQAYAGDSTRAKPRATPAAPSTVV